MVVAVFQGHNMLTPHAKNRSVIRIKVRFVFLFSLTAVGYVSKKKKEKVIMLFC